MLKFLRRIFCRSRYKIPQFSFIEISMRTYPAYNNSFAE